MSKNTNEDIKSKILPSTTADKPTAKKPAAKKIAKSDILESAEPIAKKVPLTKIAAKKTAAKKVTSKRATKKTAKNAAEPDLFTQPISIPEATPIPSAPKTTREKKQSPKPAPESPSLHQEIETSPRFDRVSDTGPVAPPKVEKSEVPTPPASIPFPQTTTQPAQSPQSEPQQRPTHEGQPPNPQPQNGQGQPVDSRSKKRREKRKRRKQERFEQQGPGRPQGQQGNQGHQNRRNEGRGQQGNNGGGNRHDFDDYRPAQLTGPEIEADGMLELAPKGFGFLRVPKKNFEQARDDVFVTPEMIRKYNLRLGQWIYGSYQEGPRGPQLVEIRKINDLTPEEASKLPHFDELKAINPNKRISFETTPERFTTRVVDIMAPVGRGQRGLIVSPPRSGKTTLLLHMAEAIREKYDEAIHLMVVLVDERPEEVTEFRRALPGAEIYASSNDEQPRNHTRIAELAIERAKRLVEAGKDVFLIMDSITRLARAYNGNMNDRGRGTGSGGITIGALEVPRRLFAAARNTRGGGSLTIMATALIQTNSRADEAIYMEFKGTGNMELVLDRKIAENYIYPAVDIFKSGTRREEILLADHMLHKIHLIRRGLSGHRPAEAMERLLFFLKKFPNNPQMLLEIKG